MLLQIYKILSNLDSFPLIYDPNLFPGKNSQDIAKSIRTFPGKGRGNRALIFTYLDSPMAEVFPYYCFFDFDHLQGETGGQSWTKSANFGSVYFSWKLKTFRLFSNNVFIC